MYFDNRTKPHPPRWPGLITGGASFTLWIIPHSREACLVCPSHNLAVIMQRNPPEELRKSAP